MIFIYRLLYLILKISLLIMKPLLNTKLKAWLSLRNKKIDKNNSFKNSYWFHASSGEIEYCKAVIRLLKERQPDAQIVVTYSSPSAEKLFYNITNYVDQFIPLCWDQPGQINELIDYIQPQVIVFSKTDLWPELITQANKRNLKIGVISFSPNFNSAGNFVNKWLLPQLDFVSCIDENTKNKLSAAVNCQNITADGDTRFDQVFYRLQQEPKLKIKCETKVFVCGSTWPADEKILFAAFPQILKKNIKIILSPHEVGENNILKIQKELLQLKISYQILSNELDYQQISLEKDVLIINKIGFLADAYRFADLAFVGGSFKEKIHSVMEPLCCGLPVLAGPFYQNNAEAVKYLNTYVYVNQNADNLIKNIDKLILFTKDEILNEMKKNLNASQRVLTYFTWLPS